MKKFQIGEVARIKACNYPEWIGRECTIMGIEPPTSNVDYSIEIPGEDPADHNIGGKYFYALESELEKIKPPKKREETTTWDKCPWQPEKLHATE